MRDARTATPFRQERLKVQEMVDSSATMSDLEDAIANAPVTDEERDALWLVSWALDQRRAERRGRLGAPPARPPRVERELALVGTESEDR